jgi:hypothetical protein
MSQRIVIGIEAGTDWPQLEARLRAFGAEVVRQPSSTAPDVVLVEVSTEEPLEALLQRLNALPGVRYAELDAWQMSS